ncbi:uncharacterized protein LOC128220370 isoform X2 [Mya arenaria]|uniref:uncharacterized protein LOC128220370 isoform X2 n=1 Tax=Mya arenaria TaxID=6604 RepID=UPI0022E83FC9|nr:uncharacterized protein LOC128220370 isoform X2 [Mya arenaria]
MMSFVKFVLLFSMLLSPAVVCAGGSEIPTLVALRAAYPRQLRCSPQNEAVFKEAIVRRMHVDKAMLEIPQVKEYYKRKYTQKGQCFSSGDQQQMAAAVADLGSIWCAYCQTNNICWCIRQYCFNQTC